MISASSTTANKTNSDSVSCEGKRSRIFISAFVGFCDGVKRAIRLTEDAATSGKSVRTFGELIHNEQTLSALRSKGICSVDSVAEISSSDTVVIRAHGVSEQTEKELSEVGCTVVDATCVFVARIHKIVSDAAAEGKKVLVAGDASHPEVIGIMSRAGEKAEVIGDDYAPGPLTEDTVLVAQTTFDSLVWQKICKKLQNCAECSSNSLEIFDTICYTTKGRQSEVLEMAEKCDAVVVIGSPSSANTARLAAIAKSKNPNVFTIQNTNDLAPLYNKSYLSIFITAGASTPQWLVEEVKKSMSENLENQNPELENSETPIAETEQTATAANAEESEVITMEDVVSGKHVTGYTQYKEGNRVKCRVEYAKEDGITVSIGGKKNGYIEKSEVCYEGEYNPDEFKDGDEFFAVIIPNKGSGKDEYISLSKKRVDEKLKLDEEAERAIASKEFEVKVEKAEKGGLTGKLGQYIVFIPASQIRSGFVKNLEEYVGKTLKVRALPPKEKEGEEGDEDRPRRRRKNIVASARVIIEEERKEKEDAFWNSIHVNDIVIGKVKRFTAFGAFVSVKGFDCLAHISELSWNKITDPSQVLTLNESYDFVILKMDRETNKISLGFKQLQKKPYEAAVEKYPIGTIIKGKVERVFNYGAFVYIEPGVDGLIHVSEISHNWIKDATEFFKVGDEVEAKVIGFKDTSITLSIKEMTPAPEKDETEVELEDGEKAKRTNTRFAKRNESGAAASSDRPARRNSRQPVASDEPREWHSTSGSSTIGDMLGNLLKDIQVSEGEDEGNK